MDKGKNNLANCSSARRADYYKKYECKEGYSKVYYECIDKKIVTNSAMYFSNFYSFPNIVFSAVTSSESEEYADITTEKRIVSYFIEIWMKLDTINYKKTVTELEYYLLAHPHVIFKDPVDQKFKYANRIISGGSYYYTLLGIQNYEWNKIIIEK